ncbi:MAG: galactokinase [Bryobacteraceae bacterium]|nr:galactokinase [Bryobacteraceae bacterium]
MAGAAGFLRESFAQRFGAAPPRLFRAPGRINLIGEHTDYNLGFVLPVALDLACYTAVAPNGCGCLRVFSQNLHEGAEWLVDAISSAAPQRHWSDYVLGVARELVRAGYEVGGSDLLIWSTVPAGAGLSSSAALEVSVALALLGDRRMDPLDLALLCRRAENEFVGMPCGIMDQYISLFGRAQAAVRIDCRSLEHEVVPLPPGVEIVAVNSMVKHELGSSAYRDRVRECREAVKAVRRRRPEVASLRDLRPAELEELADEIPAVALRRARHVVTENERVVAFVEACRRQDTKAMGALLIASHRSLQHDYEVSCDELDFLVDTALTLPGVLGARMTGGGFGGCTVNLTVSGQSWGFITGIQEAYARRFGVTPECYVCRPSPGAGEL